MSKYPRTPHLSFSRSATDDDIYGDGNYRFLTPEVGVLVTEKMDGENTTLYSHTYHARSMDSRFHPLRSFVAGFHASISWMIPRYRRVIVENLYAEHSIHYDSLESYQYGIGVVDLLDAQGNPSIDGAPTFLEWESTLNIFSEYGITPVPVIASGNLSMREIERIFTSQDHSQHEGIVCRSLGAFAQEDFSRNVAKAVREGHVQDRTKHWNAGVWKKNSLK